MDIHTGIVENGDKNNDKRVKSVAKRGDFSNKMAMNHFDDAKTNSNFQSGNKKLHSSQQEGLCHQYKAHIPTARKYCLILLYLAYYCYAMYCNFGDESSIRLTVFTGFGVMFLGWNKLLSYKKIRNLQKAVTSSIYLSFKYGSRPKVIRWTLYFIWTALAVYYLVVNVALKNPRKLRALGGYVVFILLLLLLSNNKKKTNWHCVFWGSALQCILGYFVIKSNAGSTVIMWFSDRLEEFMEYSNVGAKFVFGDSYLTHRFAMQAMPSVIVFFAAIQVLVYLGTIQFIVRTLGKFIANILDVSAPEATNACANIFLGGIESAILVVEYIDAMPTSRLFTLITNWFASCGGSALIQFISFGVPPVYLLAASAMSAPAALICAKLVYPDTDQTVFDESTEDVVLKVVTNQNLTDEAYSNASFVTDTDTSFVAEPVNSTEQTKAHTKETQTDYIDGSKQKRDMKRKLPEPKNIGEALVVGTKQGSRLVVNIIGNMIVALSAVEFADKTVEWFGNRVNIHISLKIALSYVFYPLVYIMGVDVEDCLRAGEMLGIRSISLAGISYQQLGKLIENRKTLNDYMTAFNETITFNRDSDIFLQNWNKTLSGGVFSESSELVVSYALCGFASVPMIGMTIGALVVIIPDRQQEVTKLAFRALIAGTVASYLTACVAGLVS